MRRSILVVGAAALVTALLLGSWLLSGNREPDVAASGAPAPLTKLTWPQGTSGIPSASSRSDPYPIVPSAQVQAGDGHVPTMRTEDDGRRLLIPVFDTDCSREDVRLLGEQADRVEVEIRTVVKPVPSGATVAADGSYGCSSFRYGDGPHAVVELRAPLGTRTVVIEHEPKL
jgi:hypothetical protein